MHGNDVDVRIEGQHALPRHLGFGLADMRLLEQELPVQIRHVDRVQVDLRGREHVALENCLTHHVDALEAGKHQVLEQLAANAARTDHQHPACAEALDKRRA